MLLVHCTRGVRAWFSESTMHSTAFNSSNTQYDTKGISRNGRFTNKNTRIRKMESFVTTTITKSSTQHNKQRSDRLPKKRTTMYDWRRVITPSLIRVHWKTNEKNHRCTRVVLRIRRHTRTARYKAPSSPTSELCTKRDDRQSTNTTNKRSTYH